MITVEIDSKDYRTVFERYIGEYKWGTRDCIRLVVDLLGYSIDQDIASHFSDYLNQPSLEEAEKLTLQRYPSIGAGYSDVISGIDGIEIIKDAVIENRRAGDVMWIEGTIETQAGDVDEYEEANSYIVYINNSMDVLMWSAMGLVPITGDITVKEIWRGQVH